MGRWSVEETPLCSKRKYEKLPPTAQMLSGDEDATACQVFFIALYSVELNVNAKCGPSSNENTSLTVNAASKYRFFDNVL